VVARAAQALAPRDAPQLNFNCLKNPMANLEGLFHFLFSPSTPLRAVSLSNGRFDARYENLNQFFCFR
jgi:hypothetical protein